MKDQQRNTLLYILSVLLLFPALLINLGLMSFIDDEGIRTLVALEMKLSGNYITPTLHGEFYYNKPPLYNWILLLYFQVLGQINEFNARIPTLVSLLGFAGTVFCAFRQKLGTYSAFVIAMMLITCGRILFWDSLLGLIDITFSWVVFVQFMVIYRQFERRNWLTLFVLSYLCTALGFLLKGLPAIVFQGFTLLAWFIYQKEFRRLFHWQHFLGGGVFLLMVGAYYAVYVQYNGLDTLFQTLFTESSKRTAVQFGWWKTLLHLFTFPFEMVYHFIPWSIMVLYLLRKDLVVALQRDTFLAFCALIFLANIWVYWSSVEVYPRYLLMFCPLLFGVFMHLHQQALAQQSWLAKVVQGFWILILALVVVGTALPLFLPQTQQTPQLYLKSSSLMLAALALSALYWYWPAQRLLTLVCLLLVWRIAFNWFVLPNRNANDYGDACRKSSIEAGHRFSKVDLYVYRNTDMQWTNSIYLTNTRGKIIPVKHKNFDPNALYIVDPAYYFDAVDSVAELKVRHGQRHFIIGKLNPKRQR
jgi:4-amino-4-deoxy-L-arabinose transferase-like glycosyltransferase